MHSLVPRPSPAPVLDRLQYAKTGAGEGLGTRLMHAWDGIIAYDAAIWCIYMYSYLNTTRAVHFHLYHP